MSSSFQSSTAEGGRATHTPLNETYVSHSQSGTRQELPDNVPDIIPPLLMDAAQFCYGVVAPFSQIHRRGEYFQLTGSGTRYFPGTRGYLHLEKVFAGKRERSQVRLRANLHTCLRTLLGLPEKPGKQNNVFSQDEISHLLSKCQALGTTPIEFTLLALDTGLNLLTSELKEKAIEYLDDPALCPHLFPASIYRAEFIHDYTPLTSATAQEAISTFERTVARQSGNLYTERNWQSGHCTHFRVEPRLNRKGQLGRNERTFIKGYQKGEVFRIEVTYESPRSSKLLLTPADICEELRLLSKDAKSRLDTIHKNLGEITKAQHATEAELWEALQIYGLKGCEQNLRWRELCRQVAECGVYDRAIIPASLRVRRETLRDKIAHPTWGILEKRKHATGTGAGGIPFYSLRREWKNSITAYQNYKRAGT